MHGIKAETTVDEATATAIPALRPLLGKHVEIIIVDAFWFLLICGLSFSCGGRTEELTEKTSQGHPTSDTGVETRDAGSRAATHGTEGVLGCTAGTTLGTPASGGSATGGMGGGSGSAGEAGSGGGKAEAVGRVDVPNHDDLIVRSSLMSAYEGLRVFATYDQGSRSEARSDVISNGTFELLWVQGFNRDSFGAYVVLFVDRGSDATCTPDVDPTWMDFASYNSPLDEPVIVDFDPESSDSSVAGPITCDDFNNWFDQPFRPPE